MEKSTFKRKEVPFSQVSNHALRDPNLSFKAKGLYGLIQSYVTIPGFTLYYNHLKKHCKESDHAFKSAMKELRETGYLAQHKKKGQGGMFYYEYELFDIPSPTTDGTSTGGKPTPGGLPLFSNTDLSNTHLNKTEKHTTVSANTGQFRPKIYLHESDDAYIRYYGEAFRKRIGYAHDRIKPKQHDTVEWAFDSCPLLDKADLMEIIDDYFAKLQDLEKANINYFARVLKSLIVGSVYEQHYD